VPDSQTLWYRVTNDPDDCVIATGSLLAAVALSAMTNERWGWFWCGGICPESFVSGLGGNYETDGDIPSAAALVAHNLAADAIGLGPCGADTEGIIGYSIAIDA